MGEQIAVILNPPTTEWCRDCGDQFHYKRYAIRVRCPSCGSESMSGGIKPINQGLVGCLKTSGKFNLCSDEEQYKYVFTNLPEPLGRKGISFIVDDDIDTDDPFEAADELHSILNRYMYTSQKKSIDALIEIFSDDFIDDQRRKRDENRRQELMAELYWIEVDSND